MQKVLVNEERIKATCLAKGLKYVIGRGNKKSPIWFIGEAPGEHEEFEGVAFVGPSGKELNRMATEAGIDPENCYFDNPYKVRPPDNKLNRLEELGIPKEEYEKQFWEEMDETKPTIIVACDATPTGLLAPSTASKKTGDVPITKWRGSLLTCPRFQWPHYVIPIHHPAFILRDWSERDTAVFCLRKAKEELDFWLKNGIIQPLPERQLIAEPTFSDSFGYLHDVLHSDNHVSIDIEMLRRKYPYTVGFAKSPSSAISITLSDYEPHQTLQIWRMIDEILRTKKQIGQNYTTFDACWLRAVGFSPDIRLVDDTLIRHHVLWPELSHKLEFMTMQYTREPYYKDEGKNFRPSEIAKFKRYNCKDCCVTYEIFERQEEEFTEH